MNDRPVDPGEPGGNRAARGPEPAAAETGADMGNGAPAADASLFDFGLELTAGRVAELLTVLGKTVRARLLYEAGNPMYGRFLDTLRAGFESIWTETSALRLDVDESGFHWEDDRVMASDGRDALPFLFYKDGIRQLTFLPGFEDEVDDLLGIIARARQRQDAGGDDLVTLLWEQDFTALRYGFVDLLAEGLELPAGPARDGGSISVSLDKITADLAEGPGSDESKAAQGAATESESEPEPAAGFTREDFDETVHFLDPSELDRLRDEMTREWDRDSTPLVLSALFDRLEDPVPERQMEILGTLRQLLPGFLARGDLVAAAAVLRELHELLEKPRSVVAPEQRTEVEALFEQLSDPEIVAQLVRTFEEEKVPPEADDLALFFGHLRPAALPTLFRAAESTASSDLEAQLRAAIDGLAETHEEAIVGLLGSDDPVVVMGAARAAGRRRIAAAARPLARLLDSDSVDVRRVAIEALLGLRSASAVDALQRALDDADREVRIAAARALGGMRYRPAREKFEAAINGRLVKEADLSEKIAFFEAYGSLGVAETVPVLDRMLNGKSMLGRRQPPEIRACAALALGKLATPAARAALERAASEQDPVIRNAVVRALREESES